MPQAGARPCNRSPVRAPVCCCSSSNSGASGMQFLLFGMVALLLFLLATRAYTLANPHVLARQLRIGAGVAALAGAGILVLRGMVGYAMSLAALGSWLLWG